MGPGGKEGVCARRQTVQKKGDVGQAAIAGATRGRWIRLGRKGGGRWAQLLFLPERQERKHGRSTWRGVRTAEAGSRPDWLRGKASDCPPACSRLPSLLGCAAAASQAHAPASPAFPPSSFSPQYRRARRSSPATASATSLGLGVRCRQREREAPAAVQAKTSAPAFLSPAAVWEEAVSCECGEKVRKGVFGAACSGGALAWVSFFASAVGSSRSTDRTRQRCEEPALWRPGSKPC